MFKRNLPLMVTIMVFLVGYLVCLASFPAFLSTRIICNILTDNAFLGIVAVGMTFVILSGGIDLSVGAVIAFTGVLLAKLIGDLGVSPYLAIPLVMMLGASFGAGHAAAQVAVLVAALALGLAALIAGWQVLAWRPLAVRHAPLLWILYLGYAALTLGLAVAAFQLAGAPLRFAWPVHLVASAGFGLLIIGMVTRTALGHLGRPLRVDRPMLVLYLLVLLAAVLRLLALLPGAWAQPALHAAALAWVLAFAGYGWRFFPMLVRPRLPSEAQAIPPQAAMQKLTAH